MKLRIENVTEDSIEAKCDFEHNLATNKLKSVLESINATYISHTDEAVVFIKDYYLDDTSVYDELMENVEYVIYILSGGNMENN